MSEKFVVVYPDNDRSRVKVEQVKDGAKPSADKAYSTEFNNRKEAAECGIWQAQERNITYEKD